jgi:hypothetical protein
MTVEVSRPAFSTFSIAKPCFGCIVQSSQNILLNLPVPSQDLLWGAIVPPYVNKMVSLVCVEPAFFNGSALPPGGTGNVCLPVGDVSECIFDCPGVFGFRAVYQSIPLFVRKVSNELIEQFKLVDSTPDNFLPAVTHGKETSCTCAAQNY